MSTKAEVDWSGYRKWGMYLLGTMVTVFLSVGLSYVMANMTAKDTARITTEELLTQEAKQGRLVLDGIGYRYFALIPQVLDTSTLKLHGGLDGELARAYFQMLREIQEDFRWIQKNPVALEGENTIVDISSLQFYVSMELAHRRDTILLNTLEIMCRLFVDSESWNAPLKKFQDHESVRLLKYNIPILCKSQEPLAK